jgi:hypothetical protein
MATIRIRPYTLQDLLTYMGTICPHCADHYRPMYQVALSPSGHILPIICFYYRGVLCSVISTMSLCGTVSGRPKFSLVAHRFLCEYPFLKLLLDRHPEIHDKPCTVDTVSEQEMVELVVEYAVIREDGSVETAHFLATHIGPVPIMEYLPWKATRAHYETG